LDLTGDLSIALWVKFDSFNVNTDNSLVSKHNGPADPANNRSYRFVYSSGVPTTLDFSVSSNGTAANTTTASAPFTASNGVWYFFAVTYTAAAGEARFYVNGQQQGSTVGGLNTSIYDSAADLRFGASSIPACCTYLDGIMDDVGIWSRALSANEVFELYTLGN
jgi:hypothetical protein